MERKIYASLHTHSMDLFDSHNEPESLCKAVKEMGGEGFALTQHGVLTGIEPTRKVCEQYGLKFVPGIETYYRNEEVDKRQHLILLCIDDTGYKALSMAATEANDNDGLSVMNDEILDKYFAQGHMGHGHVIATSACVNGILANILLYNQTAQNEIDKLKRKQSKMVSPDDKVYAYQLSKQKSLEIKVDELRIESETLKKTAEAKFKMREKHIEKLEGEAKTKALAELIADKKTAAYAAEKLAEVKKELKNVRSSLTETNKKVRELFESIEKYNSYQKEIEDLEGKLVDEETLVERTKEEALRLQNLFGKGNFYIEVQNHRIDNEVYVYPILAEIAKELDIPLVATNDVHIITNSEDEILRRQIIRSKRFGKFEELSVGDDQLYLKTDEELSDILSEILPKEAVDEAIANIKVIFDRCNVEFPKEQHYPKFHTGGKDVKEVFYGEIMRGIKWRFPEGLPKEYKERLNYEVRIITDMGYIDYHLIVKDFLEYGRLLSCVPYEELPNAPISIKELKAWTKEHGWSGGFSIGPGRGSAVGSLVCYLLGITSLDPLKYDLLFERFLNPERVSMPDIDSDISNNVRPYVIKYVQNKYGADAVCSIITYSKEAPKGAIRAASKYYGIKAYGDEQCLLSLGDTIARAVPEEPGTAFDTVLGDGSSVYGNLLERFSENEDAVNILKWAKVTEGTLKAYGVHAAGVVIYDKADIKEYIPLKWNKSKEVWTTQCEMTTVEEKGLLKMDFLGLKTLDIITETIHSIKKRTGEEINPLKIPLDDAIVYEEIFASGKTNSVFQFESNEMKNMLKRFHPTCFEDLIILVSMFRPGPLQFIDGVIDVKHGKEPEYITPELEPILGKTYGAIVYQEQVMEIFQKLAGYTLGGADQVRRYMSKKKADKLAHERGVFINGCAENGISEDKANRLFDQMNEFAKYAFNKSHATAYAANAYYTAWLKLYYPADFLAAAMNWADIKKIPGLMKEAEHFGVKVLQPNINKSDIDFVVNDKNIVFGLGAVKGVAKAAGEIIAERENGPYVSFLDFFMRTNVNRKATEALIKAGAFDDFCDNRRAMLNVIDDYKEAAETIKAKTAFCMEAEKVMPYTSITRQSEWDAKIEELMLTKADFKKPTTAKRLELRIANAKKKISATEMIIAQTGIPAYLPETLSERMSGEKEVMGNYVTAHPLQEYPSAEEIGLVPIENILEGKAMLLGIIENVQIKKRKKDNADMAFFELEDTSGSIRVSCFTKEYETLKPMVEEGNVVELSGVVHMDEDEAVVFCKDIKPAEKKKDTFLLEVSSYPKFHLDEEDYLKERFGTKKGNKLLIRSRIENKIREATYTVSEEIKTAYPVTVL